MREIPDLQTFCLRSVGSHSCSAEVSFAKLKNGEPSTASRLLRSFHRRPNATTGVTADSSMIDPSQPSIEQIPMERRPCIGPGSARRVNANEVDLNHPIVGCLASSSGTTIATASTNDDAMDEEDPEGAPPKLIMEYGSPALDALQSYIDSLVELGRMDDTRLGIHFFEEWKINVLLAAGVDPSKATAAAAAAAPPSRPSKRRRGSRSSSPMPAPSPPPPPLALGALSLHNCTIEEETFGAMVEAQIGPHLAVLDLTGCRGLTDEFAVQLISQMPNLKRLSLKNCRKITCKTTQILGTRQITNLECLDVGGCFNITTAHILEIVPLLPHLSELHASGLQWNDATLKSLVELRDTWKGLSLGFTDGFTQTALRESLIQLGDSLESLALPFCENVVDNALLGMLGRNLPLLKYLDLRGNSPGLVSLTGFYDGRASADLPVQRLTVLGRYSSLSENSVEETRRAHPLQTARDLLTVFLDGEGTGSGIARRL